MEKSAFIRHFLSSLIALFRSFTQGYKIFYSFGYCITKKPKNNSALIYSINLNVKIALVCDCINSVYSFSKTSNLIEWLLIFQIYGHYNQQCQHENYSYNSKFHERRHNLWEHFFASLILNFIKIAFRLSNFLLQSEIFC